MRNTPANTPKENFTVRLGGGGDRTLADRYPVPMLSDRHKTALDMREGGATFQAIGDVFGVSASRASAIYQRALVLRTEQEVGLRMRSIRVLRGAPHSPEELAVMLAQDRQTTFVALLRQPNCDRWHAEEILAWLEAGNLRLP